MEMMELALVTSSTGPIQDGTVTVAGPVPTLCQGNLVYYQLAYAIHFSELLPMPSQEHSSKMGKN